MQGLPIVYEYPVLSQKWAKLRTLNLASTFTESIWTTAH